jgi:formylglycine-generating enzyme required for sulfatase activity
MLLLAVMSLLVLLDAAVVQAGAPVVANVAAQQLTGTGMVRVTYDVSDPEGDNVTVWMVCSADNGATFTLLPRTVSGDINEMTPGPGKEILWNAAADYPGRYWAQVVAKVIASDGALPGSEMILVPAGNFTMGGGTGAESDELPAHSVYLAAYYIDKYEVTNAEFGAFIGAGGYNIAALWSLEGWAARTSANWTQPAYWGQDAYRSGPGWPGFPVIGVSWYEAEAFANWVWKALPTEAQWEKAARGTDARLYPWGNETDNLGARANYSGSGDPYESGSSQITPVGFYDGHEHLLPPFQTISSPSPYGGYDFAGNAWEWVHDWYSSSYYSTSPTSNPQGPSTGSSRVLRGGSWSYGTTNLRCAERYSGASPPTSRINNYGFRCARTAY